MVSETTATVVQPTTFWAVGVQHLGLAVVTESLRWAAFGLTGATTAAHHIERIQEALCFLRGTGLECVLETFGIDLDAETLRGAFEEWVRRCQTPYQP